MARKLRVEYAGAIYHVMNRGDRREPIFRDDADYRGFTETLGEACGKAAWQVHAYCLMLNHFHLVVETPQGNLVGGMKWFLGTYTNRFNRRHKLFGHVFSGRYKALIVDGSGDGYLKTVCDYVHLNPVRAKLLAPQQALRDYPWSSYVEYLKAPNRRPEWLRVDRLLGEMRIARDTAAGRREYERQMEERRSQEDGTKWKEIRHGWYLGSDAFKKELLAQMEGRMGPEHYGVERRESQEEKAERVLQEELGRRKWREEVLAGRRKGDPEKIKIAQRLRTETLVSAAWIARRLQMGSVSYVNNRLYLARKRKLDSQ